MARVVPALILIAAIIAWAVWSGHPLAAIVPVVVAISVAVGQWVSDRNVLVHRWWYAPMVGLIATGFLVMVLIRAEATWIVGLIVMEAGLAGAGVLFAAQSSYNPCTEAIEAADSVEADGDIVDLRFNV